MLDGEGLERRALLRRLPLHPHAHPPRRALADGCELEPIEAFRAAEQVDRRPVRQLLLARDRGKAAIGEVAVVAEVDAGEPGALGLPESPATPRSGRRSRRHSCLPRPSRLKPKPSFALVPKTDQSMKPVGPAADPSFA